MKVITSLKNPIYRNYLRLNQKKYRESLGKFLVEGENIVLEALYSGLSDEVLISEECIGAYPEIESFSEVNKVFIKGNLFKKVARTKNSQGVIAVVKSSLMPEDDFVDFLNNNSGHILILDRLQDPGNIGTMIRTAEAVGYAGIVILKGTADVFSPKVVRAAAGSVLRMNMTLVDTCEKVKDICDSAGRSLIGTKVVDATDLEDYQIRGDIALVIGNEGNGMSREFELLADENITISMPGGTESLNAAVACGIIMYKTMKGRI